MKDNKLNKKEHEMKNYGYLTGEEYRAIRKLLGMTLEEAATLHGFNDDRTLKQWESNKTTTSLPACDKITELLNKIDDLIEQVVVKWESDKEDVFLITYDDDDYKKYIFGLGKDLPNSVHTMLIYRTYAELKRIGALAYIVKFNKASYAHYMSEFGVFDTPENRTKWAKWYRLNYFNVLPVEKEERREVTHTLEEMYFWLTDHHIRGFDRYMDIVKLRMEGNNLTQVAQILGVSRQRINKMWHDLDDMIK